MPGSPGALDSELTQVRADGITFDREEYGPGIICIAAPILFDTGRLAGALSFQTLQDLRPALTGTATHIAKAAQIWHFPT